MNISQSQCINDFQQNFNNYAQSIYSTNILSVQAGYNSITLQPNDFFKSSSFLDKFNPGVIPIVLFNSSSALFITYKIDLSYSNKNYLCSSSLMNEACKNSFQLMSKTWKLDLSVQLKLTQTRVQSIINSNTIFSLNFSFVYTNRNQQNNYVLGIQGLNENNLQTAQIQLNSEKSN